MKSAHAWRIGADGRLQRLEPGSIDLERHLEDWVKQDVEIIADDVLIIGQQVETDWGTYLDLLGIDEAGNLVVIELKRTQTSRDTVAQAIEYAAWTSRLGYADVLKLAAQRFGSDEGFRTAFDSKFSSAIPESVNEVQRILIVAPAIDDTTAFVIEYLAGKYGIPINAVSFDVFGEAGDQLVVRHFTMDTGGLPSAPAGTKSRQTETWDDVLARARELGVGDIVRPLVHIEGMPKGWHPVFKKTGWTYYAPTPALPSGAAILRVKLKPNAVGVAIRANNLAGAFGKTVEECQAFIDSETDSPSVQDGRGFTQLEFSDEAASERFSKRLQVFAEVNHSRPSDVDDTGAETPIA